VFRNPDGSGIQVVHRADWQEAAAGRTVRRFAYGEIRCQHVGCKQVFLELLLLQQQVCDLVTFS
jgi:hypothetical protein